MGTELQLDAGRRRSDRPGGEPGHTILALGLLTFATNVTRNHQQKSIRALMGRVHRYLGRRFATERRLLLAA